MEQNPFKALETQKDVPEEIKGELMDNIETLKLFMEIGDLFSMKFGSLFKSLLRTKE